LYDPSCQPPIQTLQQPRHPHLHPQEWSDDSSLLELLDETRKIKFGMVMSFG